MTSYIGRRLLYMVFTMVAVSMVGFAIIKPCNPIVSYRRRSCCRRSSFPAPSITAIVLNLPTVGLRKLSTALTDRGHAAIASSIREVVLAI